MMIPQTPLRLPSLILFLGLTVAGSSVRGQAGSPELELNNVSVQRVGTLTILSGRVKNLTTQPFPYLQVNATWLGAPSAGGGSNTLGEKRCILEPLPFPEGGESSFEVRDVYNPKVNDFRLSVTDGNGKPHASRIEMASGKAKTPPFELSVSNIASQGGAGIAQVSGRVKNLSKDELNSIQARVDFTRTTANGTEVASTAAITVEPRSLAPGATGSFRVRGQVSPDVDDFLLSFSITQTTNDPKLLLWKTEGPPPRTKKHGKKP